MFAPILHASRSSLVRYSLCLASGAVGLACFPFVGGLLCLPNGKAGLTEMLLSLHGAVREGRMAAMAGQGGYQAAILRGGIYLLCWRWVGRRCHRGRLESCQLRVGGSEFGEVAIAENRDSGNNVAPLQVAGPACPMRPNRPDGGRARARKPGYGPN
jgi:hypothetical protein